jgi:D-alanyl-D-alanine carboxypeptidase-like protein
MNVKSYQGKVFVVENEQSVIRDENLNSLKYKAGDNIPPGKNIGESKIIPPQTEINITDVRSNADRAVFVFARPAGDANSSFGWTKAENLAGSLVNETFGFAPSDWKREPEGNNKTCFSAQAFIRGGPPDFVSNGHLIPQKSFVMVTETSSDKQNVKVSNLEIANGDMVVGAEIGWTRAANLVEGCADFYFTSAWTDKKGPNGCWEHANPIGPKLLVNIIGAGPQMEQVTFDSLAQYMKLISAARDEDVQISIHSAFRTFKRQVELFDLSHHGGNTAAPPGKSHHQHGQAFDLNTNEHAFEGTDPVYEWLKKNGPKHGFVRTVTGEPWHWEYRPNEAAQLPPGKFKVPESIH